MRITSEYNYDPYYNLRLEADGDEEEQEENEQEEEHDEEEDEEEEDEELGDNGKKALQRERQARKDAEKELKRLRKKSEDENDRKIREATETVEQKYHGILARTAFRAALAEAGLKKGQGKLMKLLDLEEVEVSEDGSVEGIDSQVKSLKKEFPELFSRGREGAGKGDGGNKGTPPGTNSKKSTAEILAERALGGE
jgi:hypothetical protein